MLARLDLRRLPALDRPAGRQVAVHEVVGGGLVGHEIGADAARPRAPHQLGQQLGGVAEQADRDRLLRARVALDAVPNDPDLRRWIELAKERVKFQGLPARICWLGYGDRAKVGLAFNELVRTGKVKAPIVIGRDHLDCGSVASPNRETESMKDGSDAIADWAILNALVNTACGASWVSFHHGGGVGMCMSLHAGMVVVADGTPDAARRLERVLTSDPGMGVIRHADAGYDDAIACAKEKSVHIPHRE